MGDFSSFGSFMLGAGVLIGSIVQLLNYLSARSNATRIKELTVNTNSIKDALVKVTAENEFQKGVTEGQAKALEGKL
jgi:hypothetical protein